MQTSCSACANCNPLVLPDHLEVESYRDSSSPESRIRTHSSSASTRLTATRCSMPTCSTRSNRCVKSPRLGYANTTRSGLTTASAACRPSRSCRGEKMPGSPVPNCVLDGEPTRPSGPSGKYEAGTACGLAAAPARLIDLWEFRTTVHAWRSAHRPLPETRAPGD